MRGRISLRGTVRYQLMSASMLSRCTAEVCLRRLLKGPRSPEWNFAAELATEILKRRLISAFELNDVNAARSFLDSVVLETELTSKVSVSNVVEGNVRGSWFIPKNASQEKFMLYLHGGGYSFYPKASYHELIAMFAISADIKTFVLDYRLSPEHKFPAQLNDAVDSYRWLLGKGIDPARLVVAGDSAGGNLTLALLLSIRDLKLPPPALGICLSPATDFGDGAARLPQESELDWITQRMALQWADWYCPPAERANPLVSPVNADLRGLPPIYIQAGGAENLLPSIQDFVDRAKSQGADVALEVWPAMNHVFQAFAPEVPQSTAALRRIHEVIDARLRTTANPTAPL